MLEKTTEFLNFDHKFVRVSGDHKLKKSQTCRFQKFGLNLNMYIRLNFLKRMDLFLKYMFGDP